MLSHQRKNNYQRPHRHAGGAVLETPAQTNTMTLDTTASCILPTAEGQSVSDQHGAKADNDSNVTFGWRRMPNISHQLNYMLYHQLALSIVISVAKLPGA